MDALRYIKSPDSDQWCRLFLAEIEQYIDGSKAPDRKFKDFRNHVLHVRDNYWGGAVPTAELWYGRLVECLKNEEWRRAVYCAGVLSHYIADPFMPLHTGQTEDEGAVHKLVEWGTSGAYRDLVATLPAARGIHNWKPPTADNPNDWLAVLMIDGATRAHEFYDVMIDHYDPARGRSNPAAGMDTHCRESIAHLLGRSIRAIAWVIDRAITEADTTPPNRSISAATVLSGLSTPVFFLTRRLANKEDCIAVKAILKELRETGRVIEALPEDDRTIRAAHAKEVRQISEQDLARERVRRPGTQFRIATPEEQREKRLKKQRQRRQRSTRAQTVRLAPHDDVVDAPSIGPKTAARLRAIGIHTVADLLQANAVEAEESLAQRWITEELFVSWQQQAKLMCEVPGLRGIDAQLLVGVGIGTTQDLRSADTPTLHQRIREYAASSEGKRIVRNSRLPTREQVSNWTKSPAPKQRHAA